MKMKSEMTQYSLAELTNAILASETIGNWECPKCHIPLRIQFEKYGSTRTGLRTRCVKCNLQCNVDGTFDIPDWFDRYKQPVEITPMPKRGARTPPKM